MSEEEDCEAIMMPPKKKADSVPRSPPSQSKTQQQQTLVNGKKSPLSKLLSNEKRLPMAHHPEYSQTQGGMRRSQSAAAILDPYQHNNRE